MGSIVYALTAMSKSLDDDGLLADAHVAAELFSDELIGADQRLDVIAGSAGAILGLLRLYRDTRSGEVLARATKCGEHLLRQKRIGPDGRRSWIGQGFGPRALNGMSHGAAGFAYALALLAAATGREEFAQAAAECIAFENSSYDPGRSNWPDLRGVEPSWLCQWCYGAVGIGMARLAASRRGAMDAKAAAVDIRNAIDGAKRGWPGAVDTLCCGTLGSVEFFCEAGGALGQSDLGELASQRLLAVLQAAAVGWRLPLEQRRRPVQFGLVSRPRRRGLYLAAAYRQLPSQRLDLGIAGLFRQSEGYWGFAAVHDAVTMALNISKDWTST